MGVFMNAHIVRRDTDGEQTIIYNAVEFPNSYAIYGWLAGVRGRVYGLTGLKEVRIGWPIGAGAVMFSDDIIYYVPVSVILGKDYEESILDRRNHNPPQRTTTREFLGDAYFETLEKLKEYRDDILVMDFS